MMLHLKKSIVFFSFCVIYSNSVVNPLPNNTILEWSKWKVFADDKINVFEMTISLSYRVENIVGKGENAGYQHFLLFSQCFQKAIFFKVVISRDFVVNSSESIIVCFFNEK